MTRIAVTLRHISTLAVLAATLTLAGNAFAGTGDPDPSFGERGEVVADAGGSQGAKAVAVDSQGRVVTLGGGSDFFSGSIRLLRFLANGDLDASFGDGGVVQFEFDYPEQLPRAIAVDGSGRIVVAAVAGSIQTLNLDMAFARFLPNGTLDGSFGEAGVATVNLAQFDQVSAITVDSADRIIAAGAEATGSPFSSGVAVIRLTGDGELDSSFAEGGAFVDTAVGSSIDVALDSAGRIVVAGSRATPSARGSRPALLRLDGSGVPDPEFGASGWQRLPDRHARVESLAVDPKDRPVIAVCDGDTPAFQAVRLTFGGEPDESFGPTGSRSIRVGDREQPASCPSSVVVDGSGRVVIGGGIRGLGPRMRDFGLTRLLPNGKLDRSFGVRGKITTDFGRSSESLSDLALAPSGAIIAAGFTSSDAGPQGKNYAVARYLP